MSYSSSAHGPGSNCSCSIAKGPYELALEFIETEFADDKVALATIHGTTTIEDIQATISSIRKSYEGRPARWWSAQNMLREVSLRLVYYDRIFNALQQNHPEYVSLAWGVLKVILMGVFNHAKLVEALALALKDIGYALPEAALNFELYQTDAMKTAVRSLYIHIILFFIEVAKWYKKNRMTRSISAITKPFQLDYRDTLKKIRKSSARIERIATVQSGNELRVISVAISSMQADIEQMRSQTKEVVKGQDSQETTLHRIQLSLLDIQPRLWDLQYGDILAALKPSVDPSEMLHMNHVLIQRRQSKLGPSYKISSHLTNLSTWSNNPSSSLLILQPNAGADFAAKEMSVDTINLIRAANTPIFWSLSTQVKHQPVASTKAILKTLLFQVIKATAPEALLSASSSFSSVASPSSQELTVVSANSDHSKHEWLEILKHSIARFAKDCFIVVECADLYRKHAGQPQWAQTFLTLFHALADGLQGSRSHLKVWVVNSEKSDAGWRDPTGESLRVVIPLRKSISLRPRTIRTRMRSVKRVQQPASQPPKAQRAVPPRDDPIISDPNCLNTQSTVPQHDSLTVTEGVLSQDVQFRFQQSSNNGHDGNVLKEDEKTSPNENLFGCNSIQTEEKTQHELQMTEEGGMELQPLKDTNSNVENDTALPSEGETSENEYLDIHKSGKEKGRWTVLSIVWGIIQRPYKLTVSIFISLGYLEAACDPGRRRVRWLCRCGRYFYYDFDEPDPDRLNILMDRLKRSGAIIFSNNTQDPTNTRSGLRGTSSFLTSIFPMRHSYKDRGEGDRDTESAEPTEEVSQFEAPGSSASTKHILCCTHSGLYGKLLHQDSIVNVKSDKMLFEVLRKLWKRNRGKLQGVFSLRTIRGIRFVKFRLSVGSDVEILHHQYFCQNAACNCLPPASLVPPYGNEYDYSPVFSPTSYPPFSPDWLMHKLVSPNCTHPAETEVLNQVPKRICGKLEAQPRSRKDGWGIFFEEGWDFLHIAIVLLSISTCSLIFGIAWSVSRHDASGGFTVAAWIVSVGALMVAFVALKNQSI